MVTLGAPQCSLLGPLLCSCEFFFFLMFYALCFIIVGMQYPPVKINQSLAAKGVPGHPDTVCASCRAQARVNDQPFIFIPVASATLHGPVFSGTDALPGHKLHVVALALAEQLVQPAAP